MSSGFVMYQGRDGSRIAKVTFRHSGEPEIHFRKIEWRQAFADHRAIGRTLHQRKVLSTMI
jgi:hypothetical protein